MAACSSDIRAFRPDEPAVVVAGVPVVAADPAGSASSSSLVAMMPPSPATSTLVGERLNTSASPKPPTWRPRREPKAWAASKNSLIPLRRATS